MYVSELVNKKSSLTNTRSANDDLLLHVVMCTRSLKDLLTLQHLLSGID